MCSTRLCRGTAGWGTACRAPTILGDPPGRPDPMGDAPRRPDANRHAVPLHVGGYAAEPHFFIGVSAGAVGVFAVQMPAHAIGDDVLADASQSVFGADDVFVVVALPDGRARCAP